MFEVIFFIAGLLFGIAATAYIYQDRERYRDEHEDNHL